MKSFNLYWVHGQHTYSAKAVALDEESLRLWAEGGAAVLATKWFWGFAPNAPETRGPGLFHEKGSLVIEPADDPYKSPVIYDMEPLWEIE